MAPLFPDDPVPVPVDGELDLHTFRPQEVKELIPDYLEQCRRRNLHTVRIIHGKGTGTLRRIVHGICGRLEYVKDYYLADAAGGSWGATIVELIPDKKGNG